MKFAERKERGSEKSAGYTFSGNGVNAENHANSEIAEPTDWVVWEIREPNDHPAIFNKGDS